MPDSPLNPSECLVGAPTRFAKLNLKSLASALCKYCIPGVGTAHVFSQRTFAVKGINRNHSW